MAMTINVYYQETTEHKAIIEAVMMSAYKGAEKRKSYRLVVSDNEGFVFHISCYETMKEAKGGLQRLGGAVYKWQNLVSA